MYTEDLFRLPNVIGVGVGYKIVGGRITDTISVRVHVIRKERSANLATRDRVPRELTLNGESVPTDVIESAMPRTCQWMYDFAKYRPVKGGCMIEAAGATAGAGTAGGVFYDRRWPMEPVLLTNNHILTNADTPYRLPDDLRVYQPSRGFWGEYIGYTSRIVPWYLGPLGADYAYAFAVDAGIVHVDTQSKVEFSVAEIPGRHPFVGLPPYIGERVLRRGITTRLQSGTVDEIGVSYREQHYNGKRIKAGDGNTLFVIRADEGGSAALGGDSGSLVVDSAATRGLVCATDPAAGLTYANDILDVMGALDIDAACNGGRRRMLRIAVMTFFKDVTDFERLINEHVAKFDRFRADYLGEKYEGRLAGAIGALLDDEPGQMIAEGLLADEEFSGLLNRAIGAWLIQPTVFEMLEYRLPDNFVHDFIGAFAQLSHVHPEVIDVAWLEDVFQDAEGRSMREVLDRKVKHPQAAATGRPSTGSETGE
ncbi:hypothetical protein ACWDYJ_35485 [Streptomyces sp. NPDC003042]